MFYYTDEYSKGKPDTIAHLLDYEVLKETDTIRLRTSYADITISGDSSKSQLRLIGLTRYVRKSEKGNHEERSIALFEKYVIKKLINYGRLSKT
jgi:hypothetical protein